jgi:hypothetical protein
MPTHERPVASQSLLADRSTNEDTPIIEIPLSIFDVYGLIKVLDDHRFGCPGCNQERINWMRSHLQRQLSIHASEALSEWFSS